MSCWKNLSINVKQIKAFYSSGVYFISFLLVCCSEVFRTNHRQIRPESKMFMEYFEGKKKLFFLYMVIDWKRREIKYQEGYVVSIL